MIPIRSLTSCTPFGPSHPKDHEHLRHRREPAGQSSQVAVFGHFLYHSLVQLTHQPVPLQEKNFCYQKLLPSQTRMPQSNMNSLCTSRAESYDQITESELLSVMCQAAGQNLHHSFDSLHMSRICRFRDPMLTQRDGRHWVQQLLVAFLSMAEKQKSNAHCHSPNLCLTHGAL